MKSYKHGMNTNKHTSMHIHMEFIHNPIPVLVQHILHVLNKHIYAYLYLLTNIHA
jgi:hypothetical protein